MFGRQEAELLKLRKRALQLESELNRLALMAEWRRVRSIGFWADEWRRGLRGLKTAASLALAVGSALGGGRERRRGATGKFVRWAPTALAAAGRWLPRLRRRGGKTDPPPKALPPPA